MQACPETKARALPCLVGAIDRAGPFGGADGGEGGGGGGGGGGRGGEGNEQLRRQRASAEGGAEVEGRGADADILPEENSVVMSAERGLCRLVQASGAAAAGTAAG